MKTEKEIRAELGKAKRDLMRFETIGAYGACAIGDVTIEALEWVLSDEEKQKQMHARGSNPTGEQPPYSPPSFDLFLQIKSKQSLKAFCCGIK